MVFLGYFPFALFGPAHCPGRRQKVIAPVFASFFFEPKGIMLSHMSFVCMIPGQFAMFESLKYLIKVFPVIQSLKDRIRFER